MTADFAPRLAEVITAYSTRVAEGDWVVIRGGQQALPLIESLYEAVLRRGGHPTVDLVPAGLDELMLDQGSEAQLEYLSPIEDVIYTRADVLLTIQAPTNTRSLAGADPGRVARHRNARSPLMRTLLSRLDDQSLRWCGMAWPTPAAAQQSDMGTRDYRDFLYRACGLHHPDPVEHWRAVRTRQLALIERLSDGRLLHFLGPDIDLRMRVDGRTWISAHGEMNFPDGEIFTGPLEESVEGEVSFNLPSIRDGRQVTGARLRFEQGRVVEASAETNEPFLLEVLDSDDGARRLGEIAIGTNPDVTRVTGSTLLDEKIGGSIHMAVGSAIPMTGATNVSRVHWDLVHSMRHGGRILLDDVEIYRDGEFVD